MILILSAEILKFVCRISLRLQLSYKTKCLGLLTSLPRSFSKSWNNKRSAEGTDTERMTAGEQVYRQELSRRQESEGDEMG